MTKCRYNHKLLTVLCCLTLITLHSKVVIWDLGDTLFATSYTTFARKIGIRHFVSYILFDWSNPNVQPIVFDILKKLNPSEISPEDVATTSDGIPFPTVMHKWLAGDIPGTDILRSVLLYVEQLDTQKYFTSSRQKKLVIKILEQMFDPEALVDATYPIMDAIKLLDDCHEAKAPDGTLKNTMLILSNWDTASFKVLEKRYANIFDTYFHKDHIMISGAIGLIKPEKEAFTYVLKKYKLDPQDCILIDDQYDNTLAAQSVGITALSVCKNNYKSLRAILKKLDVL